MALYLKMHVMRNTIYVESFMALCSDVLQETDTSQLAHMTHPI